MGRARLWPTGVAGTTRTLRLGALLVLVGSACFGGAGAVAEGPPSPPAQPLIGAGGSLGRYMGVEATRHGDAPTGYWLFEPTTPRRDGDGVVAGVGTLPIVLFLHGFTAIDPDRYRLWIDHIVRRGAVVVYPDYQRASPFGEDWRTFLPNTLGAVRGALDELKADGHAETDPTRLAVVGHSLGGVLAAGYAARAAAAGLPHPDVLMVLEPGGCAGCPPLSEGQGVPLPDLSRVPAATKAVVVVGDADDVVGDGAAKRIWAAMTAVPPSSRDYVTVVSDGRGVPPLRADHLFPQTGGRGSTTDALDWYGSWKLLDLLTDCAFAGLGCGDALGGTARQRAMGVWSDGTPVTTLRVTDDTEAPDS